MFILVCLFGFSSEQRRSMNYFTSWNLQGNLHFNYVYLWTTTICSNLLSEANYCGFYDIMILHLFLPWRFKLIVCSRCDMTPLWFLTSPKKCLTIGCNTLPCDVSQLVSLLIPPALCRLLFSVIAPERGCQSSCAPHLGRSASIAKERWVPVFLHSNAR